MIRHAVFALGGLLLVAAVAGCTTRIILRNPATNETRDCFASALDYAFPPLAAEQCAKILESAGWQRLGSD